jgi:PAS domain S-box-containing protein
MGMAPRIPSNSNVTSNDWRLLVESVEDYAIFMLDPSGIVLTWNRGAQKHKGYAAEEVIGRHFSLFYSTEDVAADKPRNELADASRFGRVEDEGWRIRKDGSRFWANVVITALRDDDDKLVGFAKVTRDLTTRREGEESLRHSEERLRLLVESVEDYAIYMLSPEGCVTTWNAGAQKLKGYAAQEIIGEHYARFFPTEDVQRGKPQQELDTALKVGRFEEEGIRVRKNGERFWANVVLTPIRDLHGKLLGFAKVTRDLTARKAAEEIARKLIEEQAARFAAEAAEAKLRESEARFRNAAERAESASRVKDEFLSTASHELRTPLNAIVGWSTILKESALAPSVMKAVEVIHRNALAQVRIVDDVLDMSRIVAGKLRLDLRAADLSAVIGSAIEVVQPSADAKQITISFEPPASAISLVADPDRLQQVFWNLLSNAVKFSSAGDHITVTTRCEGSRIDLFVHDTGRGIAPDFLPCVFDRFQQADGSSARRIGGLGLGLAIVRHLVELHGGQVDVQSKGLGKGASFQVTLPIRAVLPSEQPESDARPSFATPQSARLREAVLRARRVLVVDDEPDARELVQVLLEDAGAVVETAASAEQAMGILPRFRPHVLVSDIGMPGEDGYSLMRRVKDLAPSDGGGIPSLALSAYTRGQDKNRAILAGFTMHLAKPVDPHDLVVAVSNLAAFVHR